MEVLTFAGVPTVMFLDAPSPALLARLEGYRAFGIAGIARSQSPEWMDAHLPRIFKALQALGAPILHYKTCSTFDSAPHLGSIGRATEIGLAETGASWAPLVVGAPAIGRYQIFGTLFAALDGMVHRLDRHPVMARHPATPMHEADICRHLDAQTTLARAVVDFRTLLAGEGVAAIARARKDGARIVALDAFDEATLAATGRILWQEAGASRSFAVGSQGVEYALVAHWRETGLLPADVPVPSVRAAKPLLVVSGSCSQTTARQIATAKAGGFAVLRLDALRSFDMLTWAAEIARVAEAMTTCLSQGRNTLICTAEGPDDPAIAAFHAAATSVTEAAAGVHARIGNGLGQLVRQARVQLGLSRAIFAGGDTSGHAMLAIGADALTCIAPLAPGVPLLRVLSRDMPFDGMEVALKGGQMGEPDLFLRVAQGSA